MEKGIKEKLAELDALDIETSWSKEDLWDAIVAEPKSKRRRLRQLSVVPKLLPWAAAVLIFFGVYMWLPPGPQVNVEQIVEKALPTYSEDETEDAKVLAEGIAFIHETCKMDLEICSAPEFKELYSELLQVEEERASILDVVDRYGADEMSTKALIQLKNIESSITSELILMIAS